MARRQFLGLGGAACLPLLAPSFVRADKNSDRLPDGSASKDMITAEAQRAIDRGLEYLATHQESNGAFGNGQYAGNVAVTSLAALAFMAGGNQPGRGKYGKCVERAINYVISQESRDIPGFLYFRSGSTFGAMYGHGFGTLLLGEAYGMASKKDFQKHIRDTLERAVKLIESSQNTEGGWRYDPKPTSADVSVTICQIMALRSARNAGLQVNKRVVDKCTEYVKQCQNKDGGFKYMRSSQDSSAFARSAAGVVALYCAGIYEGKAIDNGLRYLMEYLPGRRQPLRDGFPRRGMMMQDMHYFYGQYYAVQAMWTAGGKYWQEWFPAIREELLSRARSRNDGSWGDTTVCTDYATAMALIILQVPNNYLPIMQK
jgi:hypothetical protein